MLAANLRDVRRENDRGDRGGMNHLYLVLLLSFQSVTPPVISPTPVLPPDTKAVFRANDSPACARWRDARAGKGENADLFVAYYRTWVLGYITGFNFVGPDQTGDLLGTATREEFYGAIDGYCTRNPSRMVVDAMRPVITAIVRRREIPATARWNTSREATIAAAYSCRDWIDGRKNKILSLTYVTLLHGYITAYNQWGPDPLGDAVGVADDPLTENVIDKWCSENPKTLLVEAVQPLIDHVAKERVAGRLPPGGVRPVDKFSDGRP